MSETREYIGHGTDAQVYKMNINGVSVALKRLTFGRSTKARVRFINERDLLKGFNHPCILKYIEIETEIDIGQDIIYTECLDIDLDKIITGQEITEYKLEDEIAKAFNQDDVIKSKLELVNSIKQFTENILPCLLSMAEGLHYLHTLPDLIIHRDLKPGNVFINKSNKVITRTVIGDFGYAVTCKFPDKTYTSTDKMGTPLYMAHEIITPQANETLTFSTASNMWAYGIICWSLLTRRNPYDEFHELPSFRKYILNGGHPCLENISGNPELIKLMGQCWCIDPIQRPSAQQFIELIKKIQSSI